ncbi:CbbBc protein [Lysobacter sp. TY2-98]|uniref:FdhF/YdeP family oxidoreductase n=1 Tax=Lysobacter sp. TY2-98 TaxID=2290922 RepID=UPI000E1FB99D|nr:FdhF/YdeP family oxidoreductase [Lysobacter sp. TY2-98]AXK70865.1 CbbBc protein [Lysobacter sp. TY2-98]
MTDRTFKPYTRPAGGWDSLRRSWQALREEGIVATGTRTMLRTNQDDGFDCPGCAWPDRNPNSTFEFCENGVKAVAAEATARRVTREFFAQHTVTELAAQTDHWLEAQGRLTEPMRYDASTDRYMPIAWDAAFAQVAGHLNALASPDEALFYTSGRTSNEAAFLYQLFVRAYGTNNLPDCSNLCHEASGVALTEQIGSGKGSVLLEDFEHAEAIFIFGQNPGTNHPRMLGELREAARRGCRIVVFNPLRERGLERFAHPQSPTEMLTGGSTKIATDYYTPRIGGDLAALTGIAKALIERGTLDRDFIATYTTGFEAFATHLAGQDWPQIEAQSGLTRAQLEEAAAIYDASRATIFCWGMGITQHRRSVATIQMLMAVLLLKGNIGKPGAGPCPVRGHSNVQGDRTMGIYEKPSTAFLDALQAEFGFEPPHAHGHDVVSGIEAMLDGRARVLFAMGGNFAAATPDTARTAEALRRCDLTVHVSTKLNRSHLVHGREALILPCLGRSEIDMQAGSRQAVSVEDSMSMVHLSCGLKTPASDHLMSEPAIVAHLAAATLHDSRVPWMELVSHYDRIRERIARVVPGFEDFNARVRVPGGFHLHHPGREREFPTASGRAGFFVHPLQDEATTTPFKLMTVRSHDQYNTTIYGLDDRYRGVLGLRRVCFINARDLSKYGWEPGQLVDITSVWHDGERTVQGFTLVDYDIPDGCLASYFPETNPLVPLDSVAERAGTPTSKAIAVRLTPSAAGTVAS